MNYTTSQHTAITTHDQNLQIIACAGVLEPLLWLMYDRVRRSAALHADDTSMVLLDPRRTAHAWVYVGDAANPYTVFDLSVGRSGDAPA